MITSLLGFDFGAITRGVKRLHPLLSQKTFLRSIIPLSAYLVFHREFAMEALCQ